MAEVTVIPSPTLSDDDLDFPPILDEILLPSRRSESPLRKRARHRSSSSITNRPESSSTPITQHTLLKRDPKYYFSDGSCIIRIENTLFNVHRTILSVDTSSFGSMFSLPQGDKQEEGTSDDNPIVLQGDTAEEFRNFLWSLYALPHELMSTRSPQANLTQLIDIARVANKYSFKSTETWALDAIHDFVNRKPSPILTSIPASHMHSANTSISACEGTEQLTRLVRLAQMCNHAKLLETMVSLLQQLMSSSLQYAYLAMTIADELNLRSLRGAAYLEVMEKAKFTCNSNADNETQQTSISGDQDRLVVTPTQQLRLLSGHYRLSTAWERLRVVPPHFEHAPSCGATWHQNGCTQSWTEFWKEKTRIESVHSLAIADVLGRLKAMAKEFDRWGSATYMHHDCRMSARRSIHDKIKQIQEALPDYFSESGDY
ncbi:hypothetical protein SERLA73DRAFT_110132 [Serpula lacrymans var. lacrymans S7.3]|uniref:BTB domain-containing protein n=2 Tax=Serpula lacrymans var. lacrymans TaxID=341189 RepID=F8Q0C4_SERL3|nr:uncharacterized protein SERLADRAFT_362185 [Serpula lacrymans var. lacrymans S7.9]EGN98574.1 hypothetical protein SERLA73DRAFT_110132 [Serpula lacrymans var. lacrymans S7.3]EGO24139.1 hypothetical protein SERLADRAFT_362185 [Serpula lacrymans var. lacrymans S7.9]